MEVFTVKPYYLLCQMHNANILYGEFLTTDSST